MRQPRQHWDLQMLCTSLTSDRALMVMAPAAPAALPRPGSIAFASCQPFRRNTCGWMYCGVAFRHRASARYLLTAHLG